MLSEPDPRTVAAKCLGSGVRCKAELGVNSRFASRKLVDIMKCMIEAQGLGQIDPNTDIAQAAFEIEAMLLAANFLFVMMNEPIHLTQGRRGVENLLVRLAVVPA
jgi:hypothetical protein